jgi:hypothetical protein
VLGAMNMPTNYNNSHHLFLVESLRDAIRRGDQAALRNIGVAAAAYTASFAVLFLVARFAVNHVLDGIGELPAAFGTIFLGLNVAVSAGLLLCVSFFFARRATLELAAEPKARGTIALWAALLGTSLFLATALLMQAEAPALWRALGLRNTLLFGAVLFAAASLMPAYGLAFFLTEAHPKVRARRRGTHLLSVAELGPDERAVVERYAGPRRRITAAEVADILGQEAAAKERVARTAEATCAEAVHSLNTARLSAYERNFRELPIEAQAAIGAACRVEEAEREVAKLLDENRSLKEQINQLRQNVGISEAVSNEFARQLAQWKYLFGTRDPEEAWSRACDFEWIGRQARHAGHKDAFFQALFRASHDRDEES